MKSTSQDKSAPKLADKPAAQTTSKPVGTKTKSTANLKPLTKSEVKEAKRKQVPRWKRWAKRGGIILGSVVGTGVLLVLGVFAWFARDLPSTDQLASRVLVESTKIYDRSGEHLLYETGKDVRRTYITIDHISQQVKDATIAAEDKNFYSHHGFDPIGILRAAGINLTTDRTHGGSTITQQFVKLAIVGSDQTPTRKIKELILSIELERKYDKDKILEFYLNEAGYGGIIVGIEAAAQSYFNIPASDLTLAQAALLSSIPKSPTYYTGEGLEDLYARKDHVLDLMADDGFITKDEATAAKAEPISLKRIAAKKEAPHFVDYVLSNLEDDYGSGFINQGLRVTTTLDYDKQKLAEQAISDGMVLIEKYGGSNAGLVSMDAHTGQVLAMVGSKDYYADDYDGQVNVTTSLRQPGSSIKPIVYVTAFANGYGPTTMLFDEPTTFPTPSGPYNPTNFGGRIAGPVSIRTALGQSLNIPAVKTLYLVGLEKVLGTADSLGYTTFNRRDEYGLSFALGSAEVRLLEHTSTFATFAREGLRHPIATILKVEDHNNQVLYEWSNSESQVIDQGAVQQLNSVLSDSAARAGFTKLNITGKTTAGKTGTSNDFHDAWTMLYTPSFATGVWVGNNNNEEMDYMADGVIVAAPIANAYMTKILDGLPNETFSKPPSGQGNKPVLNGQIAETVSKVVDKFTNHIIPDDCVDSYPAEYKANKDFKEAHTILYYLRKEDPLGSPPSNPASDPMFTSWEAVVQKWASGQADYISDKTEYEDCNLRSPGQTPSVTITSPAKSVNYIKTNFFIDWDANPGSGRSIKKVEYLIDSTLVDTQTSQPFTSSYNPATLTTGSHTLVVRVTNDRDNVDEASMVFNFTATSLTNTNTNSTNTNKNTNSNKNSNTNTNKKKSNSD